MTEEKRLALLIDSDNVSAKYAQFILEEASKFGELIYKRIYGDWEKGNSSWHYPTLNNSIMPVQQTAYIAGKNATDFSMIIDAMDILYTGNVDGFVLVTSDSDFTRLAIRLREAGKFVVGIGEVKTPLPFTSSCHKFIYLNQVCETEENFDEVQLRKDLVDFVRENDDGKLDLPKVQAFLTSKYGNIDYNTIGYNRFSSFIDSFPEFKRKSNFVTMKNPTPQPKKQRFKHKYNGPTAREITDIIVNFLKHSVGGREDITKIDKFVTVALGKIDYSRFGSKKFAKFIDNQKNTLYREGSIVYLAEKAPKNNPEPELPPAPLAEPKFSETPTESEITDAIIYIIKKSGNGLEKIQKVQNQLEELVGKVDYSKFGAKTFAKFLDKQTVLSRLNQFVTMTEFLPQKAGSKPVSVPQTSPQVQEKSAQENPVKEKPITEKPAPEKQIQEKPVREKAELNAVKREIQIQTVQHNNSITLPALGKLLRKKFGDNYLKDIGALTLKQLVTAVAGVKASGNSIKIDENFIARTEQIEEFVCDFVEKNGKVSIKMLSTQIKKKFSGFDFTDYGYSRFSDFINAIDGVKADRYHVEAN